MVSEKEQPAEKYISRTGTIHQYDELERVAWEHSTPTDLTDPPVKINGLQYYPITDNRTFLIEYTENNNSHADMAVSPTLTNTNVTSSTTIPTHHQPPKKNNRVIQLTLLTPEGTTKRTLSPQQIVSVKPINIPNTYFPIQSSTYPEQATELEKYAGIHPNTIDPQRVTSLLTTDPGKETRRPAIAALRHIAPHRPSDCITAITPLKYILMNDTATQATKRDALYILSEVATHHPREVTPVTSILPKFFTHSNTQSRVSALQTAVSIARIDNTVYQGHEETFVQGLSTSSLQEQLCAAELLAVRASHTPSAVLPYAVKLVAYTNAKSVHTTTVATLLVTIRHITSYDVNSVISYTDIFTSLTQSKNEYISSNALSILHIISQSHPEEVLSHVQHIGSLLDRESTQILINVVGVIARLAQYKPRELTPFTHEVLECIEHDHETVRLNACCTLEHIGEHVHDVDTEPLEALAADESELEETRSHAHWALEGINS